VGDAGFADKLNGSRIASSDISKASAKISAFSFPKSAMSDKYISLSIDETVGLLKNWHFASTKLRLKLSSIAGVSFSGTVRVAEVDALRTVFVPVLESEGKATTDAELAVRLFDSRFRRVSPELPRLWLVCVLDDPDLRLVLTEETVLENLDDLVLASTLEQ
jgi:hypothetical protein